MIPSPIDMKNGPYWVYKSWAFLWLIRFIPSTVASIAVFAGFRLSGGSQNLRTVGLSIGSTFMVTSACSAWNDYRDRNVDAINLPYRPVPSGILSARLALYYAIGGFIVGNILAFGLGLQSQVFFGFATFTSIIYSPWIKKLPAAKNLYVAVYCASLLMFAGYLGGNIYPTLIPAVITVTCLTARELLMDIHDIEGDRQGSYQTAPIAFGIDLSRQAVSVLLVVSSFFQIWLLMGMATGVVGKVGILASAGCFLVVAVYVALNKYISVVKLLSQIRLLMIGIIMGVLALTFS